MAPAIPNGTDASTLMGLAMAFLFFVMTFLLFVNARMILAFAKMIFALTFLMLANAFFILKFAKTIFALTFPIFVNAIFNLKLAKTIFVFAKTILASAKMTFAEIDLWIADSTFCMLDAKNESIEAIMPALGELYSPCFYGK